MKHILLALFATIVLVAPVKADGQNTAYYHSREVIAFSYLNACEDSHLKEVIFKVRVMKAENNLRKVMSEKDVKISMKALFEQSSRPEVIEMMKEQIRISGEPCMQFFREAAFVADIEAAGATEIVTEIFK